MNLLSLANYIKDNYDLQHEDLTVVFPNKRAALYLRLHFREIYNGTAWMPQMLSVEEAMSQWCGIQLADTLDLLFELIAIDSVLEHHGNSLATFGNMAAQMAKDFDEIDQYAVDAKHLFNYVYEEKSIGIWCPGEKTTLKEQAFLDFYKRLYDYYNQLRERLFKQGKGYYGMITRTLAEMDDETLRQKTKNHRILFVGFNALTPTEQKIIDTLYKNGQAKIIWDFDRYYVEDANNEAGFFARQYLAKDLLWKPTEFSDQLRVGEKEIHLVGATGNTIQAKALQSLLQNEKNPKAAVILADENLLIPVMNSIPDNGHYNDIKVSMGYPLRQTALSNLVNDYFKLRRQNRKVGERGWYLWPILRILNLEIINVIFTDDEVKQIAEYQKFIGKKSLFIYDEKTFNNYCTSPDLQQFMSVLLKDDSDPQTALPVACLDTLINLLKFVATKIQSSQHSNTFLLNQVSEMGKAINRLKNIICRYHDYVQNIEELESLYRLICNNISIKLNSDSIESLQVMGILETRNLDLEEYYMVGVNDGVLPTPKAMGSFIPYNIRKECGLPDYREKQAVYAYHFYRLLQRAKKVHFIYNANTDENRGEPSRFLMQLEYELAKVNHGIKLTKESFINKTEPSPALSELTATKALSHLCPISPSNLNLYISCPLKYYLMKIAKINDDHLEEDAQENDIGSVIHKTLEVLFSPYHNTVITPELFSKAIIPAKKAALDNAIKDYYDQGLSNVGYNYLNEKNINKLINKYINFEKEWVSNNNLSIIDTERELTCDIEAGGFTFHIKGKADRIDRNNGMIRIIDYKTGTVKNDHVKVPKVITSLKEMPDKAVQLLIYKYLYLKNHPEVSPDQVTAAIYGLRYEQMVFNLKVDNQELEEDFMNTMEDLLGELLVEMMDLSTPYQQTTDKKNKPCRYCDFKNLCVNTAKGELQEDDH